MNNMFEEKTMKAFLIGFLAFTSISSYAGTGSINCEIAYFAVVAESFDKDLSGKDIEIPEYVKEATTRVVVASSKNYFFALDRYENSLSFSLVKKLSATTGVIIGSADYEIKDGAVASVYVMTESGASLTAQNCVIKL
jgi:hypothetical protein